MRCTNQAENPTQAAELEGVLFDHFSKQTIVTKSSTEAVLVGLSDSAAQATHLKNFVEKQGYSVGWVVIYQDIAF